MNLMRTNIAAQTNARRIIFLFLILSGILISVLYIPLYLTSGQEKVTNGKITFTDLNSNPLTGTIKISGSGITGASHENINSIIWSQVPNAIIDFDAFDTIGLSLNVRIYKDSPYGHVMIGDHGQDKPANISLPAPGQPIKYVEIESKNVNFADSNVTLRFTDDEIATINETDLTLYIFDTIAQDWKELTTLLDTQNNTISATVDVMSVFALGPHVPGIPGYIPDTSGKNWTTFKEIITEKLANETPEESNNISESENISDNISDNLIEIQTDPGIFSAKIDLRDFNDKPIAGHIRTYDKNKNPKAENQPGILSTTLEGEEIEFDALESKNVAVRLKVNSVNNGKIIMDDFGKKNPVSVKLPGKPVKFVEVGASSIDFSSAEVTIKYSDAEIQGFIENNLAIFHWNGSEWEPLFTQVDSKNNTLTATSNSLSPFGVSETVVYRWVNNTGTTVASGFSTNWASCGALPNVYTKSLLTNASSSGCNSDRQVGNVRDPAVDLFFNYNYTIATNVKGNWYYGRLRDAGTGGGTFTFKLIYILSNGTIVALPGSGSRTISSGSSNNYNISLSGISGTVPAGAKLGLRISKSGSSSDLRIFFGDLANQAGNGPSGYFSITDSVAANYYNLSGYVFNQSSGLPLNGATVETNTSGSTTTDSNGYYSFSLVNGTYLITASRANYDSNSTTKTISGSNVNNANISLTPMPTYQISGHVTNQSSGEYLSGVNLTTDTGFNATTDANGFYIFYATNGTHVLTAIRSGYGTEHIGITVNGEVIDNVNFELIPSARILVTTNRYVINDDPVSTGKIAQTSANFSLPWSGSSSWGRNDWTANQTTIKGYALLLDSFGAPIHDTSVSFTIRNWNDSFNITLPDVNTDSNGIANISYDMEDSDYYGNWYVYANSSDKSDSAGFIYNWWGCNSGGCRNHNSDSPGTATSSKQNSPYTLGRETIINDGSHGTAQNDANCVGCHRSYGGTGGGSQFTGQPTKTSDVHTTNTCTTCHASNNTHRTDEPIKSCRDCHNRTDLSNKTTMSGSPLRSNYSYTVMAAGHNYNSTIPCIICHGPMHNITKPDESIRFTRNNNTEASHCMKCHTSYQRHNNSINCTLCHSDDIHVVQVFSRNATYIVLNKASPSSDRGDCTLCHQNATFFSILRNNSKAGNQTLYTPPIIPNPTHHSDAINNGTRYGSYWTTGSQDSACQYCHGKTEHETVALGRPSLFRGSNMVNATFTGGGNTTWCLLCHYPGSANYSDMVAAFGASGLSVPPSIVKGSAYYVSGRNHSDVVNDSLCYTCHNSTTSYTRISQFMHDVAVGGGGPDCLGCHDIGATDSSLHVNNTAMKLSFHKNLNNLSQNSSGVSADNKKCWGCHQSDGSQPIGSSSMGDKYNMPYTCDECHLIGNEPYANMSSAPRVTNHIWLDSSITRIITPNATCTTCHNNSVYLNIAYITDQRTVSAVESVSHYGSLTNLVDTVSDLLTQGCVFCHRNTINGATWGGARNIVASHSQTTNTQCYTCHIETVELPDSFHNSSMYFAGSGKILVTTNRYVILDDPIVTGKVAQTTANFSVPPRTGWTSDSWNGARTQITGNALLVDRYGRPINNTNVTFKITNWNSANSSTSPNVTTDSNGLANYTFDMNGRNYYGNWNITANATGLSGSSKFIFNWFGCQAGGTSCTEQHGSKTPGTATPSKQNSPYTLGRESITGISQSQHNSVVQSDANCVGCHRSYSGVGGGSTFTGQATKTSDVHVTNTCATCHASVSVHNTDQPIKSCNNCHNRTDISNKTTKNGIVSNYSKNTSSTYNKYHTPNSTVPCIICHGPMHAITKPDTTIRFQKNNITEYSHCISCHQDYVRHNRTVSCPVCHSEDIHAIKVFAQNATFITLNRNNPNTYRGNCTNCHQNSSFFSALLSQPKGGNHTGQNPEQIPAPMEHSNDPAAGKKWNQTPGYWTNSNQVTWCNYCHTDEVHSTYILGHVSLFKGNNTVNSTISANSSWCSSCHWQGYTNGSSSYSDMSSSFVSLDHLVPPEISGHSTYGANQSISGYTNHNSFGKDDLSCFNCHKGNITTNATITDFMHNVSIGAGGGPNCITCHNLVTGLSGGAPVGINFSSANSSVHYGINSNNATSQGYAAIVGACWACHESDGNVASGHPDRYKTPKTCPECHLGSGTYNASSYNATIVSEHYYSGTNIRTGNSTSNISSCINCHETSGMILYSNDMDTGSFSGDGIRLTGGNLSYYHYGKQRTDIRSGASANCSYCHQNASTAFNQSMVNPASNRSISNHSLRYNSSNPGCTATQCHNTGWLHNSTLTKPTLSLPNSTYCMSCHGSNGSAGMNYSGAVTGIKAKHNNTINCTECHLNTSRDIHPLKYLQPDASFGTNNSTAVNCISCHQNSTVYPNLTRTPPKIANPMHHSDNVSNGMIWNTTGYWNPNSTITSCIYCHNDSKHNSTALGRPNDWKGNNVVNASINTSNWCSSCHYRGYSSGGKNYSSMTSSFISSNLSVPPEITNGTYAPFNFSRYYNHSLTNYSDASCLLCHGTNISSNAGISAFLHNITSGTCTSCHYSFDAMNSTNRPEMFVDSGMYNTSLHRSLTCQDCHTQGHKNIGARKACEDCHVVQETPITDKDRHNITATPSTNMNGGTSIVNITDCNTCHNSALLNNSRNTYGYGKPKDCDYCHTYPDKVYR